SAVRTARWLALPVTRGDAGLRSQQSSARSENSATDGPLQCSGMQDAHRVVAVGPGPRDNPAVEPGNSAIHEPHWIDPAGGHRIRRPRRAGEEHGTALQVAPDA